MITRKDIAAHLEKSIRTGFLLGGKEYSPLRSAFTGERPSDGAFEQYADMGATPWPVQNAGKPGPGGTDSRINAPAVNALDEGGAVQIVGGEERALLVYNLDWEIGIGVTHNAINDDRAGDLESWARGAASNFEKHKDYEAFRALNSGEATTNFGAGYDGYAFFSGSHVDPNAIYTTAQDNQYTLALDIDNFETVRVAAGKFLDSRGKYIGLNHNLLIVPPDLERVAVQIAGNDWVYDSANREKNPYAGSVQLLVAPGGWLDTTAWFIADTSQAQKPLYLQMRQQPKLTIIDDELQGSGGIRYYKWHARYTVFYGDWRLCVQGQT